MVQRESKSFQLKHMNKLILISLVLNVILALPCVTWITAKGISVNKLATLIDEEVPRLREYFELGMECVYASYNDVVFVGADSSSKFDIVHFRKSCGLESFLISWNGNDGCSNENGNKIFIAPDCMLAFLHQKDGSQSLYLRYNNNESLKICGNALRIGKKRSLETISKDNR